MNGAPASTLATTSRPAGSSRAAVPRRTLRALSPRGSSVGDQDVAGANRDADRGRRAGGRVSGTSSSVRRAVEPARIVPCARARSMTVGVEDVLESGQAGQHAAAPGDRAPRAASRSRARARVRARSTRSPSAKASRWLWVT